MEEKESLEDKLAEKFDIDKNQKIYFNKEVAENSEFELPVNQVVNTILQPYGFETYSQSQFKRVAGGSKHSSNLIKNYKEGYGRIKNGYTYLEDIVEFCLDKIENSVKIPIEKVKDIMNWSSKMVYNNNISLRSGGGKRYAIEAIMDLTKGLLTEEALVVDAKNYGHNIELDRSFYSDKNETDSGQDVKRINGKSPDPVIQIKDMKYFLLVEKEEFYGDRNADYFIGYRTQWNKENTGMKILNHFLNSEENIFENYPSMDYIRVQRKGWAKRDGFEVLKKGEYYKGKRFTRNNNMFVYYEDLNNMDEFFENEI